MNKQGGTTPNDEAASKRAKKSDLVTLPQKVEGTNCANCKYVEILDKKQGLGFCVNKKVFQLVTKRMCCALWDADGTLRSWKK